MIRVMHVLNELRASGAEVQLRTAGRLWERFDVVCDIAATAEQVGPFASSLEAVGYDVHHLPFRKDFGFFRSYAALVADGAYDVVHVQMERASFYLCVAARAHGAGVVRTARSAYPFEGNLARRRGLQRHVARALGTQFVAISPTVARNERDRFSNRTLLINNWIDDERFVPPTLSQRRDARRVLGIPEEASAVVTVGNCSPIKNHPRFLEAFAKLDDPDMIWLHVGEEAADGPERRLAENLGAARRCRFLGRTDPLVALHAADLFAMPSLYEGLGMATVEALSTGLPVLLTDVPGNRDLKDLAQRAWWSSTDVDDLATVLRTALREARSGDDAEMRKQHQAVASRHGALAGVSDYARLYHRLATT